MNKRVLIICPNFPPVNSADMHRVRHMLNYLHLHDWDSEVVAVSPVFIDSYSTDPLLVKTIPSNIKIHYVNSLNKKITSRFGLGSLAWRSYFYYLTKVNKLLRMSKYDLVFFSTTEFNLMTLGRFWKWRFSVPYVLDIQDPWRNDYYLDKPKEQRPPKFLMSYALDKFFESITIPASAAVIAVSKKYIFTFKERYSSWNGLNKVIPFAFDYMDFEIASNIDSELSISFDPDNINFVYIGRGGHDLSLSLNLFFGALKSIENSNKLCYDKIKCHFIGTSYASLGKGNKTIEPIANIYDLGDKIIEITDRLPYFEVLKLIQQADVLLIPGSTDDGYTASKIYPYIMADKPILAVINEHSSVKQVLTTCTESSVIIFNTDALNSEVLLNRISIAILDEISKIKSKITHDSSEFVKYSAKSMTMEVVDLFNSVCNLEKK